MKRVVCVAGAALLLGAVGVQAQVGVAGRVGTFGIGGEAALQLAERLVLRGGVGFSTLEASTSFDGVPVDLELPDRWANVGLDVYLNGAFRIGGGVAFKPDAVMVRGAFSDQVQIGTEVLTPEQVGALSGRIESHEQVPYVLIGFGKHTASGFGLSLDLGAAVLGNPSVSLDATGGTYPEAELRSLLLEEAADFESEMKTYLKIWPILSLGLRFGFR